MFKKFLFFTLILGAIFGALFNRAQAAEIAAAKSVEVHFFYSVTCPVCAQEEKFLTALSANQPDLAIFRHEVSQSETINLLTQYFDKYQVAAEERGGVPVTFLEKKGEVGKYLIGYSPKIDSLVEDYLVSLLNQTDQEKPDEDLTKKIREISLPFLGKVDLSGFSPLVLSMVVGGLDGFNACAMAALGFLLMVLIATGERKRVLWIGGVFILASGVVYFLFIAAWLNLFLFLGYTRIISIAVSVLIIVFAIFLLKDYFWGAVCKICEVKEKEGTLTRIQRQLFTKIHKLVQADMPLVLVLLGVAIIAGGINLIELFCSFGFPLTYTKVLASHGLPTVSYYFYLLIYIIFYMLDDFLIFLIALITLRVTRVSEKYFKVIGLISGLVLLALGILMLVAPQALSLH